MEKDLGSWWYHLQSDGQFLNSNNISSSGFGSQRSNGLPANGFLPGYPYNTGIPQTKVGQLPEQFGWSYCLPRFRQAFTSMQNKSAVQRENLKESVEPNPVSLQQKRFLVFDQSGDQTTLMFSSGIGNQVPGSASLTPKLDNVYAPVPERMNEGNRLNTGHLTDDCNGYHNDDNESEMREDTEELNALLYSDDDSDCDDYEEEEETSTGHSPNIENGEEEEEVANSVGRRTVVEEEEEVVFDVESVMDTASSGKRKSWFEDEQDAESYCCRGVKKKKKVGGGECDGKSKKEKIRETVGILQKIIPGSRGKDAIVVLDEAIAYLKALQCKAEAVGFEIS
ncbi:transcription factor SAC51-like [Impatiens glandulifera]|uniref:transcription factor SAC51-like n=1 Tax=Impatiens glandulifera TaxID=253017 RepID=UPI001FB081B4|nr:transcription factor SAC51-like [Impatiens glandulifera]